MSAAPNQTPYLHLDLGPNQAENRNWAIIDDRLYRVVAKLIGDIIGPGMITLDMLAPEIVDRLLPTPFGSPSDLLMLNANGTPVWAPASTVGQLWIDTGANLQPSAGAYPVETGALTIAAPPTGDPSWLKSVLPMETINPGMPVYRHDLIQTLSSQPAFTELCTASESWTGSTGGVTWSISTAPTGQLAPQFRLLIDGSGYTVFPNTKGLEIGGSTIPTPEMLQVNGAITLGASTNASPLNGTIQSVGGVLQARKNGGWVEFPLPGIPAGGLATQVLTKNSNADYDASWLPSQGGAGDSLWLENVANNYLTPKGTNYGIQLSGGGDGIVFPNSQSTITQRTGLIGNDALLMFYAGQQGFEWNTADAGTQLLRLDQTGVLSLDNAKALAWLQGTGPSSPTITGTNGALALASAAGTTIAFAPAATTQLTLDAQGATLLNSLQVGADVRASPLAGAIQYTAGHFMGRVGGTWTQLDNLPSGPFWTAPVTWTAATGTLSTTQYENQVSATLNAVTLTLPLWSAVAQGTVFRFTRTDSTPANQVTIQASGTDTIDASLSFITLAPGECVSIIAANSSTNNVRWFTTGRSAWVTRQAGNVIIPTDSFKVINAGSVGDAFVWPARTTRGRLLGAKAADTNAFASLAFNYSYAGASALQDSTAEPCWTLQLWGGTIDACRIVRAPATSGAPAFSNLLVLDGATGTLSLPALTPAQDGVVLSGAAQPAKAHFGLLSPYGFVVRSNVAAGPGSPLLDDSTRPGWSVQVDSNDQFAAYRAPATAGAPAWLRMFNIDSAGNLNITGKLNGGAAVGTSTSTTSNTTFNFSSYDVWSGAITTFPAITTRGGLVLIFAPMNLAYIQLGSSGNAQILLGLYRNTNQVRQYAARCGGTVVMPYPWAVFVDNPPAGTYTYDIRCVVRSGTSASVQAASDVSNMNIFEVG